LPLEELLAPLPVECLRIGVATAGTLHKLGLLTVGQVLKLPRAGVSRRFPDLLPQLDKALGRTAETIEFLQKPPAWVESLRFPDPISAPEDLERATVELLERICARLEAERQAALRFEVRFFRADGGLELQSVSTASPTRDVRRVMRLFREKLGGIDPGFGVDAVMLRLHRIEPRPSEQPGFLREGYNAALVEELAVLIEALENRLGEGRVYRIAAQESYIPARAVKKVGPFEGRLSQRLAPQKDKSRKDRLAGWQASKAKNVGERPIRLFSRPHPIEVTAALPDAPPILFRWRKIVHRIIWAEGPERISPEWWRTDRIADENGQARDYYRVENAQGLRFWVFREGFYGGERMPRWYLHGVFA
jgi:protein ImuB